MEPLFVNRVAASGLVTLNLEEYIHPGDRVIYDIKDNLFHGLMLREKDFREFVKTHDWAQYDGQNVAIICSGLICYWPASCKAMRTATCLAT
jgi:hypothetical protein